MNRPDRAPFDEFGEKIRKGFYELNNLNGFDKFINMILSIDKELSNYKDVDIKSLKLIKKYTSDYLNYREEYLDRIYEVSEKNERKK